MPNRLAVVISQSAVRSHRANEAEEALLTELMLTAGLDATLVSSLESIQTNSTDYLCLSGFSQSLAIVSSLSFEAAAAQWQRLQLPGEFTRLGDAKNGSNRRVYFFPLELGTQQLLSQLRQLLVEQSIQTVSVALPSSKLPAAKVPASKVPAAKLSSSVGSASGMPAAELLATRNLETQVEQRSGPPVSLVATGQTDAAQNDADNRIIPESEWINLDRLIDDFDTLDL